jgi:hypothetical protein
MSDGKINLTQPRNFREKSLTQKQVNSARFFEAVDLTFFLKFQFDFLGGWKAFIKIKILILTIK